MIRRLALALVAMLLPALAAAEEVKLLKFKGSFEDATFAVESAIVAKGLKIDSVSHVGAMLNRTAKDVGATKKIFGNADVFQFCSATLSRKVMEADFRNIAYCPYAVFVIEAGDGSGAVQIGYREMPKGPMKEVEKLLETIAKEAAGG